MIITNHIDKHETYYNSPIGLTKITASENGINSVDFIEEQAEKGLRTHPILDECVTQLDEYFKGKRKEFTVKLNHDGTEFQKKVWNELLKISFGKTVSYLELAKSLGDVKAIRAVGKANSKNKIAIIIPCHRVIGSNGNLTGYAGGLWRKEWLLKHEGILML
ncbi:MAG: methylated-DNA--[protein]-cysteine S-methyltransferase [Ignavibacteria bacterium]|nr:methylated-DNA--[protein]-cysteine S-methyltransferase [Ignavibacteria bacterium]